MALNDETLRDGFRAIARGNAGATPALDPERLDAVAGVRRARRRRRRGLAAGGLVLSGAAIIGLWYSGVISPLRSGGTPQTDVAGAGATATPPAPHQLGAPVASISLSNVLSVEQLSNGSVLVNEVTRGFGRLLLLDSMLTLRTVVLDSAPGLITYGNSPGLLIPFRGDSTYFVANASTPDASMLLLGPGGAIAGAQALPLRNAPRSIRFDAQGRLVYMVPPPIDGPDAPPLPPAPAAPDTALVVLQDSAPLIRVARETRQIDTAAFVTVPAAFLVAQRRADGPTYSLTVNPIPVVDEWAVTSDGTIAIVRGRDYHIDWISPDGARVSTPPIPFNWQPLSDSLKTFALDSIRRWMEDARATVAANEAAATGRPAPAPLPVYTVPRDRLPDRRPPFTNGAVRADADGNIWIRTSERLMSDGYIYDVVNRRGALMDRVQVPPDASVVGFGRGGVVYVGVRDSTGYRLLRTRER